MSIVSGKVTGAAGVREALKAFQAALRTRALKEAVNEGTAPMLRALKAGCPVDKRGGPYAGLLRKSLGRKTKSYAKGDVAVGLVGARSKMGVAVPGVTRTGRQRMKIPTKYAHLAERKTQFTAIAAASSKAAAAAAVQSSLEDAVRSFAP